ncbi:MAG: hypothetical protein ABSF48_15600 [Thermodesulfobacteriota bacterium]|jgi:hypothetical protein
MTNSKPPRHALLFGHDFLSFIETEFPGADFYDDFPDQSHTEVYFIYKNEFYLIEIKSESDSANHPGYKYETFLSTRQAILALGIDGQYDRWLLYLAQLHDYTMPKKQAKSAANYPKGHVMLGLPYCKLNDCKAAINMASTKINKPAPQYYSHYKQASNLAYILMGEQELVTFIQSIKDAHFVQ